MLSGEAAEVTQTIIHRGNEAMLQIITLGVLIILGIGLYLLHPRIPEANRRAATWAFGIVASVATLVVFLVPGAQSPPVLSSILATLTNPASPTATITPSAALSADENKVEKLAASSSTSNTGSDWRSLSFMIPNPQHWEDPGDNRYVAVEQHDSDAFAWSTENFEGDLSVSLELYSAVEALELEHSELDQQMPNQNSGCVVIYGNGQGYSDGSLIFCIDWDGYYMWKHTRYTDEYPMAFVPKYLRSDKIYAVNVEISDDLATMDIDGERVFSTFFDTEEIDRSGRIGLLRYWENGENTFSNIQVKSGGG